MADTFENLLGAVHAGHLTCLVEVTTSKVYCIAESCFSTSPTG